MNCMPCRNQQHEHCDNFYNYKGEKRETPTTTWCACQHKTDIGTYLDSSTCKHHLYEEGMLFCPQCGKVMDDQANPIGETTSAPIQTDNGQASETAKVTVLDPETERDQRDNFF